jgi:hypothetical protein
MFKLSRKIAFYIPSTDNKNEPISDGRFDKRANKIARLFASLFGGSTIVNCDGCFVDSDGRLIVERIKRVYSFCDSDSLEQHYDHIVQTAVTNCENWYQQSIAIEIDDTLILVDKND